MAAVLLAVDVAFTAALAENELGQPGEASHVCAVGSMTHASVVVVVCLPETHLWHNILFLRLRLLCAWVRAVDYIACSAPLPQRQQMMLTVCWLWD